VIHLLFSANRWEAAAQIRADIAEGVTIVIDRYYYSGIVYSAAKDRPDLTIKWAREPEVGLPRPDICLFLDIMPEAAAGRGGFGVEKYENSRMQRRVRALFFELLPLPEGQDVRVVNANQSIDKVTEQMSGLVEVMLQGEGITQPLRSILPWTD
jgi:dTMP kinase